MKALKRISTIFSFGIFFLLAGCVSNQDENLEKALFALDKAQYEEAETRARAVLEEDPDNNDAKFILATALMGRSILGEGGTYLTLLADLLEDQGDDESGTETFLRISRVEGDTERAQLAEARDALLSIPLADRDGDTWMQLYFARLFEISVALSLIGANSPDNACGFPEDLDPAALDEDETERFDDNLNNVNNDADQAGLPSDFGLTDRLTGMLDRYNAAVDAAGSIDQGLADFFTEEFDAAGGCP